MKLTITCNATEYLILSGLRAKGFLSKAYVEKLKEVLGEHVYRSILKLESWRLLSFYELGDRMLVENIPLKTAKLVYRKERNEAWESVAQLPLVLLQDVLEEHFDKGLPIDESILLQVHKYETRRALAGSYDHVEKHTIFIEGLEDLVKDLELNCNQSIQFENGSLTLGEIKHSKLKFFVDGEEVKLLRELTTRKGYPIYIHEGEFAAETISGVSFKKYGEE